jgi:hypothetical protein
VPIAVKVEAKVNFFFMILDVIVKNSCYCVLDENNKEVTRGYVSSQGNLVGFSSEFMVFTSNSSNAISVKDENFKEISRNYLSSLGEFLNVSGSYINFKRGNRIYTLDKNLKEVSNRYI